MTVYKIRKTGNTQILQELKANDTAEETATHVDGMDEGVVVSGCSGLRMKPRLQREKIGFKSKYRIIVQRKFFSFKIFICLLLNG
jgi:hypothetical protein